MAKEEKKDISADKDIPQKKIILKKKINLKKYFKWYCICSINI